jgi:3-oxoacyl-[acyl-carrier-protein] synthase II
MKRRVVVTGLGAVSPLGTSVSQTWENAIAGKSGIGPITRFDASPFASRIAGEIKNFAPLQYVDKKKSVATILLPFTLWLQRRWLWKTRL